MPKSSRVTRRLAEIETKTGVSPRDDESIRRASELVTELARSVFGSAAFVTHIDDSASIDGAPLGMLEVRYPAPKDEEQLLAIHEGFLHRYVREIPADIRGRVTVVPLPQDAD